MGRDISQREAWSAIYTAAAAITQTTRPTTIGHTTDNTEQAVETMGWEIIAIDTFDQVLAQAGDRVMLARYDGDSGESYVSAVDVTEAYAAVLKAAAADGA